MCVPRTLPLPAPEVLRQVGQGPERHEPVFALAGAGRDQGEQVREAERHGKAVSAVDRHERSPWIERQDIDRADAGLGQLAQTRIESRPGGWRRHL